MMGIVYGVMPSVRMLLLPLFVVLSFGADMGGGLWFAALNVRYSDFRYVVPFIIQFGLYLSPVGFLLPRSLPAAARGGSTRSIR